jgi:hypothetical protein
MNQIAPNKPDGRRPLILVAILLTLALAAWLLVPRRWEGFKRSDNFAIQQDGNHGEWAVGAGRYLSLGGCRRGVEKTGGWCGKDCRTYKPVGAIADCDQLLIIPKKRSN